VPDQVKARLWTRARLISMMVRTKSAPIRVISYAGRPHSLKTFDIKKTWPVRFPNGEVKSKAVDTRPVRKKNISLSD
jgi:hypothetical protein